MSEDLTLKQRKWIKEYLECGNATEAAMRVYDCKDRDSAKQIGWENLTKLDFGELMEEAGITDDLLQKKLKEGLDATNVKTSLTEPDRTLPDYAVRHKYLDTALKLKKKLIERKDITSGGKPIPILNALYNNNSNKEADTTQEEN